MSLPSSGCSSQTQALQLQYSFIAELAVATMGINISFNHLPAFWCSRGDFTSKASTLESRKPGCLMMLAFLLESFSSALPSMLTTTHSVNRFWLTLLVVSIKVIWDNKGTCAFAQCKHTQPIMTIDSSPSLTKTIELKLPFAMRINKQKRKAIKHSFPSQYTFQRASHDTATLKKKGSVQAGTGEDYQSGLMNG
ncbi:hypothetical protein BT96DRAFT_948531 [Gymnopus androsaceus JB14]|uniref:Uncharacterized protein n=1 Tax=Gymnopus androsaceus JB14 TaxID=1447944 RepID=A0A6A4GN76_9AGAR|nr:hypothetical protein BT96DRAFT_948531 [Gymnopus androsaceus JB14]